MYSGTNCHWGGAMAAMRGAYIRRYCACSLLAWVYSTLIVQTSLIKSNTIINFMILWFQGIALKYYKSFKRQGSWQMWQFHSCCSCCGSSWCSHFVPNSFPSCSEEKMRMIFSPRSQWIQYCIPVLDKPEILLPIRAIAHSQHTVVKHGLRALALIIDTTVVELRKVIYSTMISVETHLVHCYRFALYSLENSCEKHQWQQKWAPQFPRQPEGQTRSSSWCLCSWSW